MNVDSKKSRDQVVLEKPEEVPLMSQSPARKEQTTIAPQDPQRVAAAPTDEEKGKTRPAQPPLATAAPRGSLVAPQLPSSRPGMQKKSALATCTSWVSGKCGKKVKETTVSQPSAGEWDDKLMIVGDGTKNNPGNLKIVYLGEVYTTVGIKKRLIEDIEEANKKLRIEKAPPEPEEDLEVEEADKKAPEPAAKSPSKQETSPASPAKPSLDAPGQPEGSPKPALGLELLGVQLKEGEKPGLLELHKAPSTIELEGLKKQDSKQQLELPGLAKEEDPSAVINQIQSLLEKSEMFKKKQEIEEKHQKLRHAKTLKTGIEKKATATLEDERIGLSEKMVEDMALHNDLFYKFEVSLYGTSWT